MQYCFCVSLINSSICIYHLFHINVFFDNLCSKFWISMAKSAFINYHKSSSTRMNDYIWYFPWKYLELNWFSGISYWICWGYGLDHRIFTSNFSNEYFWAYTWITTTYSNSISFISVYWESSSILVKTKERISWNILKGRIFFLLKLNSVAISVFKCDIRKRINKRLSYSQLFVRNW